MTIFKRILLTVSFLAYAAALAHNFIPHHHHEEEPEHHDSHHSHQTHHHHHSDTDDSKSLSYFFSEAIHHPASKVSLHSNGDVTEKVKPFNFFLIAGYDLFQNPEFVPPDANATHKPNLFPIGFWVASSLRGPPVA